MNKFVNQAVSFLLGILIGVLASVATFSSRIAVVETQITEITKQVSSMNDQLTVLLRK